MSRSPERSEGEGSLRPSSQTLREARGDSRGSAQIRSQEGLSPNVCYDLAYYVETEERHFGFFTHKESQLVRVQCKLAWLSKDGAYLIFNTSTVSMGGAGVWKKKKSGYRGRADWFGVYSPDTGKVYMVSVWDVPDASNTNLRLLPPKNNQEQGVRWAKDYEI